MAAQDHTQGGGTFGNESAQHWLCEDWSTSGRIAGSGTTLATVNFTRQELLGTPVQSMRLEVTCQEAEAKERFRKGAQYTDQEVLMVKQLAGAGTGAGGIR